MFSPKASVRRACLSSFLLVLFLTVAWQSLYCRIVAGGNPTALFLIGDRRPYPADLKRGAYIYPNSLGYDGMTYRLMAHAPLPGGEYQRYVDDPRYRYRRILVPGLAWLLAGGNPSHVDLAYIAVIDLALAAGAACFALLFLPWLSPFQSSLLYCAVPAVVASADRMMLDGVMFAGFAAVLLFYRLGRGRALTAVCAALPLVREITLAICAGAALASLRRQRFLLAAAIALATTPAFAWFAYVAARTPPSAAGESLLGPPLWPYIARLFTRLDRPVAPAVNTALQFLDVFAAAAMLVAFACIFFEIAKQLRARDVEGELLLLAPVLAVALCFASPSILREPYDFGRQNSPLLFWAALRLAPRTRLGAAAILLAAGAPLLVYRGAPLLRTFAGRA